MPRSRRNDKLPSCAELAVRQDLGELIQRLAGVDHGGDVDLPAIDEIQGALLGVGVDEGGLEGDLLLEDLKGLHGHFVAGGGETEEHDGGLLARDLNGLLHGGDLAHALDDGGYPMDAALLQYRCGVLCDGVSKSNPAVYSGRTEGGKIVFFHGEPDMTGNFVNIRIERTEAFALWGEIAE